MIKFIEDTESNYKHRTIVNAEAADATLAFAVTFNTPGEILTRMASKRVYIPIKLDEDFIDLHLESISRILKGNNCTKLNIAGNGIRTLKPFKIDQEKCDKIIYDTLYKLINDYDIKIESIRSGGQTGADESGLKAGERLNIETICLCPKGWRFRPSNGEDISNEVLFKQRF